MATRIHLHRMGKDMQKEQQELVELATVQMMLEWTMWMKQNF